MSALIDTSVLIDVLRGRAEARDALLGTMAVGRPWASEITRLEVLAGMRESEREATEGLLGVLRWRAVDRVVAERAGALGRIWLPSHGGIDAADLAIAATAEELEVPLLTRNVRHFPMFEGLAPPY